jgi:hypothetical protein
VNGRRFQIRRDGWAFLLALFGGTAARSFVEVDAEGLHLRFGWLFYQRVLFEEIESVATGHWPWWGGIGWRSNLVGRIGLIGSYHGIVDINLRRRRWIWMLVPLPCTRLTVSLEDPEGFVTAVSGRVGTRG